MALEIHGKYFHERQIMKASPSVLDALTTRQHDILILLAKGLSNKEIARMLRISENTVINHVRAIYLVLGVQNRAEATCVYYQEKSVLNHHKGQIAYQLLSIIMGDKPR